MTQLILASTSPYKRDLLSRLGVAFEAVDPSLDEAPYKVDFTSPIELSKTLAFEKAKALTSQFPDAIILGSDQVCHLDDSIFSKSGGLDKAKEQLKKMRGREHSLTSSYCLISKTEKIIRSHSTILKMKNLSDDEILAYLKKDKPFDCAGSYKIERGGIALFDEVSTTDFTSIVGLPLMLLAKDLSKLGAPLWEV